MRYETNDQNTSPKKWYKIFYANKWYVWCVCVCEWIGYVCVIQAMISVNYSHVECEILYTCSSFWFWFWDSLLHGNHGPPMYLSPRWNSPHQQHTHGNSSVLIEINLWKRTRARAILRRSSYIHETLRSHPCHTVIWITSWASLFRCRL